MSAEALTDRPTSDPSVNGAMEALVYRGTDLRILKGEVPSVTTGRILGDEGVDVIEAIASSVI
jgi:alcohol dehydrogenase